MQKQAKLLELRILLMLGRGEEVTGKENERLLRYWYISIS